MQHIDFEPSRGGDGLQFEGERKVSELFNEIKKIPEIQNKPQVFFDKIISHPLYGEIDTQWMEKLQDFDHWNFFIDPKIAEKLRSVAGANFLKKIEFQSSFPIPRNQNLVYFSVLHFLKTQKENRTRAYENYIHNIQLLFTQGNLLGGVTAAMGIRYGAMFKEVFKTNLYPNLTPRNHRAHRRVGWAWATVLDKIWKKDLPEKISRYTKPEFGVCSGVGENPMGINAFYLLIKPSWWPLEHNFEDISNRTYNQRNQLMEACNMVDRKPLIDRSPAGLTFKQALYGDPLLEGANGRFPMFLASIPYVRRAVAGVLMTVAMPNFTGIYHDNNYQF